MAVGGASRTEAGRGPDDRLVGRDAVVDELTLAAGSAANGAGCVVLLTGEAGIGKTSVARALANEVRGDLAVSWGKCSADRSAPPFWPWRDVLPVGAPDARAEVEAPLDAGIGASRYELLRDLRDQLLERAVRQPLLHVIEDLQWADVASVLLLVQVSAAVSDAPLMVVGSVRTGEPRARLLDDAIEEARRLAVVWDLKPLSTADVSALLRAADLSVDADLAVLVRDRTGGNPLFVAEVIRLMRGEPADRVRDVVAQRVPDRVSELIAHRLARLPPAVADIVAAASVFGGDGDARTLAEVNGSTVDAALELLEQGRAARLLDAAPAGRWQFRHDLVRDAVYQRISDADRARRHVAVLEALAASPSTPVSVLAHHALAAQPLLDGERAVALAARAGESAFSQHAYEEAVGWLTKALDAAPGDMALRWRADLLVLQGEAHRHVGEIEEARRAFLESAELTDAPELLARAALGYADPGADLGIAYRTEDPMTAPLLVRAIEAQPHDDSVTRVLLEARLAAEQYFSDEPGRARELTRSAVERAGRLGDLRALGAAWAVTHDAFVVGQADLDAQLRGSEQLLAWAYESGSAAARLTAHRARVFDLLAAGDIAGMDADILAFRRVAAGLDVAGYRWWLTLWSAMRALLEGRHDAAEARATEACEIGARPFSILAYLNMSFLLFFLRREQGRLAEMESSTRDYAASHADVPALRVGLAFLLAETGHLDETRGVLADLSADDFARLHDRNWPASWFQLARCAALVGDRNLAMLLLEDAHRPSERVVMVSLATACLGATDLAEAWLLHTVGELDAAAARYTAAEEVNARIGARSWLAQARADHARLLLDRDALGDHDAAASLVELAAEAAGSIGLRSIDPLLEALDRRLGGQFQPVAAAPESAGAFRRSGSSWDLEFAGRAVRVPHARGMRDLAVLLARPGAAVSVLELLDGGGAAASTARGAPALDERARRAIRERLHDLDAAIDEAEANHDGERAALAREERQQLAEAVARDLGLGGRSRRIDDPVERARKTVSIRIRRTIASIGRVHPELGRHLERSIDTGAWCAYRPAETVTWST